jgi:penicillin-binding protein 2
VNAIISPQGKQIKKLTPEVLRRVDLDAKALAIVRQGLMAVTGEGGTAHQAFVGLPVKVAGKTGSAQNSQGPSHGWFAGMAPAANPRIIVIVLVEHGTSGAMAAAPVARKVFDAFFRVKATAKSVSTVLPAAE